MPRRLIIVESPAKCNKIQEYAGEGYLCTASFGHLRELNNIKNIDFDNNCKPLFTNIPSKLKQISTIKKLISQCDDVILATDDDREGEAIAWHICEIFKLNINTTKRIIFHEITKTAIQNSLKTPTVIDMNKVNAQQSRQLLDLIVGFKVSPILWNNISRNNKTGLSAGRCQTPALKIIYDNYNDIKISPGTKVYNTTGYFTKLNLPFELNFKFNDEEALETFLEDTVNHEHIYSYNTPSKSEKKPPVPFTTSGLQQTASNILHISPKETMKLAQELYEGGYITYMRTDSKAYSKEFIETAKGFITNEWSDEYINPDIYKICNEKSEQKCESDESKSKTAKKTKKANKKDNANNAQEAHESIRPTKISIKNLDTINDFPPKKKKLYKIIWENTIESCMSNARCLILKSLINSSLEKHDFKYSCEQITFPGWKIVKGYDKECKEFNYLQTIKNKSVLNYNKVTSKVTLKDLKQHHTEAKLVQLLEDKGIGRPSTFSSLIDKIQERGYVKKENVTGKKIQCNDYELIDNEIEVNTNERVFGNEKNKLVIQTLGILVIEFLTKHFNTIFNYDYTKNMEERLDTISKGDEIWYNLCYDINNEIITLSDGLCNKQETIKIDDNHTYMIAKHGPVIKYVNGDESKFLSVKKDLDIEKLKSGFYKLGDIIENVNSVLGRHEGKEMILKKGKFGLYVTWGENKHSLNGINIQENELNLENILQFINEKKSETKSSGVIKSLNETLSIRKGKYGLYLFYKTSSMTKPKFLNIKDYVGNIETDGSEEILRWVKEKYKI